MMSAEDVLSQLKPLQLPSPITESYIAPGWWGIYIVTFVVVSISLYFFRRYYLYYKVHKQYRERLREQLSLLKNEYILSNNGKVYIEHINMLLKQLSIKISPQAETAVLSGELWIRFLKQSYVGNAADLAAFSLLTEVYREKVTLTKEEVDALSHAATLWINSQLKSADFTPELNTNEELIRREKS